MNKHRERSATRGVLSERGALASGFKGRLRRILGRAKKAQQGYPFASSRQV
ncbi:MAG: hypothetical protein M1415_10000 [Firmicutes bacterium]|nr:hypothetical protein [Bacillota bacterium]